MTERQQLDALELALATLLNTDVAIRPRASRVTLDVETAKNIHRMIAGGGMIYTHRFIPATDSGAKVGMCADCPRGKYSHMVTH